ncbi:MAG: clan AA aspartic protease [bacterium]|nr:clan AA aspartic protease [bacterium]MXZ29566.1 clan AA aspartic protease [Acidimicrobiia bacterium]MDE0668166.1 clan AA aspartic protease [bacterium]MYB25151.1 clan AA aspartic protease [Acidimicrobiia bacterium]MYE67886.1 clan AA aspartic protease [Acidimicrobiia bacterium]
MGETRVDVTIRNPADSRRCWEGEFVVDTGAIDSVVPRRHLEAIGVEPLEDAVYLLADGSEFHTQTALAQMEFEGRRLGSTVIFGPDDVDPLLGVTALESGGFAVDPVNNELRKVVRRL